MKKLIILYRKYWLIRLLWWLGIVIPGIPFILISVVFLLYVHWPREYVEVVNVDLNKETQYITLSAHGVKDSPESWSDTLQQVFSNSNVQHLSKQQTTQHISLNWQPYSDNVFVCSVAGKNIGEKLANKILKLPEIKGIHLIGHSCGSFVIFGLCEQLKTHNKAIKIQTTYLDPVSVYSGIFWQYGINNFGHCADFSDAYIDTEDRVPGSNQALRHSITFDVTRFRLEQNIDIAPHVWPTHFYIEAMKKQQVPIYLLANKNFDKFSLYQKGTLYPWQATQ